MRTHNSKIKRKVFSSKVNLKRDYGILNYGLNHTLIHTQKSLARLRPTSFNLSKAIKILDAFARFIGSFKH